MGKKGGLFRYADGVDKLLMLLGTLGSIGDGLSSALNMYILSGVLDEFGGHDSVFSNKTVDKYTLRVMYVAIGVGISAFIEGVCWTRTAERQTSRIRMEYLKSVLRQEVGFFDNQDATSSNFQVVSTISSDAHLIQDVIAEKIPNFLANISGFVSCFVAAFMLSWRLALASLPVSLGLMIPGIGFGKVLVSLGVKMNEAYAVAGSIAEQALSSIRIVYSYVGESQTFERFSLALEKTMNLGIKQGFMKGLVIGSMAMAFAAWGFQSWVGSVLVVERGESGGRVFISAVCVMLGAMSCMGALPNVTFLSEATIAATKIFKLIDRVPDIDTLVVKGKVLSYVRGEIEFKDVKFCYPSRPDLPILRNFNLKVKAGKTVGLVGGSGSGKSTVIALLERFYDPVKGDILLDGYKINRLHLKWLRSQIGLVNQEPVLFATSIKENILFGKEDASVEEIEAASKAANAHDFISKLPEKYETQVGQFGTQLSGGQKQRIAIARALIKNPKILLLDEATSALDAASERIVQEALDHATQGRTTIVVAHCLTTIYKADKIIVLQSGKIVESGTHDELIQYGQDGVYFQMVQLQQSASKNETSSSHHSPLEVRDSRRMSHPHTPKSPFSQRTSWQNSPVTPFSPALSTTSGPPIQMHSYYDSDHDYIFDKPLSPSNLTWRLLRMNAPEWPRAFLGCLGGVIFGAIQPIHSFFLGTLVSIYLKGDKSKIKSETKVYSLIFLSLGLTSLFANILQHHNFAIMGERLTKRVREALLKTVLTFEVGWFDNDENTSAAICARLSTDASLVRSLVAERMSLILQVSTTAVLASLLGLIVTWRIAVVMIAMQPVIVASFYTRSVLMKEMSEKAQKAQIEGSQLASEAVINHKTITAFSSQKRILRLFAATLDGPKKESIKQSWLAGLALLVSQFLATASMAFIYWYGGRLVHKGTITPKHLFEAFFVLMSTGKNIADAGSMTSDLTKGNRAIGSVFEILDRKTEINPEDPEGRVLKKSLEGKIELKHVFFYYPSRPEQVIFQGLNLRIEPGRTVALVGQSGSGKSTVIGLIERFYDPVEGAVLLDDRDIKSYNLKSLRSLIALVSQEPTLFAGTIRENITYGKEDATDAEIKKAAMLANAHEFISAMKEGYETCCGERGAQLSGGQKQRIVLARAMLKNPAILLLDEATSALDSVSESLVQEALERMMVGRTCVIVAHRLSTIQKSDTIAVIKNGKVVEQGSHSKLLAAGRPGAYYQLIKLQNGHSPSRA